MWIVGAVIASLFIMAANPPSVGSGFVLGLVWGAAVVMQALLKAYRNA